MTTTPPTAAEMRAVWDRKNSVEFAAFSLQHWPALIAMREELERLRRDHAEGCPLAGELRRQLAESRAECERLNKRCSDMHTELSYRDE